MQKSMDPVLFPFKSRWMDIDGHRIHYVDEGQGAILLFCHPSIATSFMYRRLISGLSPKFRCVALDLPGFGLSEAKPGFGHSIASQARVVEMFVERLGLAEVIPLVQEIGGHAAIVALARQPHRVKAIILTDTIVYPVSGLPRVSRVLGFMRRGLIPFLNAHLNLLVWATYRFGIRRRKLSRAERRAYAALFDTRQKRRLVTHYLYQLKIEEDVMRTVEGAVEGTFRDRPFLLVYGEKDALVEMGIPERIMQGLPNARLHIVKGEGHFPHEGAPAEMVEAIQRWLVP